MSPLRKAVQISFLLLAFLSSSLVYAAQSQQPAHTFGWSGPHFLLDGKPFQILSGEMHYARVPRPYWRQRMRLMKAMGLNTLTTYVFWNLHEPRPGEFDFSGNLDIAEYIRIAQQEGLWVILRPGPYICSEWDFGGFPAWLLATPDMKVRSTDPRFLAAAERYMKRVGQVLAPLQITHGGPIIMTQVENEYGSFGNDKTYMNAIRKIIVDSGFDVTLYTADGASRLAQGTLSDVLSAINFGASDSPEKEFARFDQFRRDVPKMCGEYWVGWFDAWGQKHHTVPPDVPAKGLDWMLGQGISVSLYMFHGGTSFGFMSGANKYAVYTPDITSYDYDSPVDEAGRTTPKFFALRDVIKKHLPPGTVLPDPPPAPAMIEIPRLKLTESASLFDSLPAPVASEQVKSMEMLGQGYGLILYRAKATVSGKAVLKIAQPRDYAVIYQNRKQLGLVDRGLNQISAEVTVDASQPLDILVENMGRVNFGPNLVTERKGIAETVSLNDKTLSGWKIFPLPLTDIAKLKFSSTPKAGPLFYRGSFDLQSLGDTYLDMRGWGKGQVWVNGHNVGRYWSIGPQQSLFVPAEWMLQGKNEVIVFDYESGGEHSLGGIRQLVFETHEMRSK
ncbi:MAG TPA: glycoside hydrolase family 35 protein [Candidatus Sulfotelmatobacter sp.]|nr:glycoside hydrolase family 35 protein [Candidatus Sulfotelmatobacter sp.]